MVQAPEHVIENDKALAKAGDDPKKRRKVQRKKPPEGSVTWSEQTFDKLVAAEPEPLVSRMRVSHSMLLNVIARARRPVRRDAHAAARQPRAAGRAAPAHPPGHRHLPRPAGRRGGRAAATSRTTTGRTMRLTVDLQRDFALNQPLSPFALAALELLDPESPTYALDVVSVIEATLDDPRQVLLAQQFKARGEAVAEMKAEGIEYEERMELLEDVTWPEAAGRAARGRLRDLPAEPPVGRATTRCRPKSVVRDMYERAMTFGEFVAFYGLARSEGWCCATSPTRTGRCGRPSPTSARPRSWPTSSSGSASSCARSTPACSTSGSS